MFANWKSVATYKNRKPSIKHVQFKCSFWGFTWWNVNSSLFIVYQIGNGMRVSRCVRYARVWCSDGVADERAKRISGCWTENRMNRTQPSALNGYFEVFKQSPIVILTLSLYLTLVRNMFEIIASHLSKDWIENFGRSYANLFL